MRTRTDSDSARLAFELDQVATVQFARFTDHLGAERAGGMRRAAAGTCTSIAALFRADPWMNHAVCLTSASISRRYSAT